MGENILGKSGALSLDEHLMHRSIFRVKDPAKFTSGSLDVRKHDWILTHRHIPIEDIVVQEEKKLSGKYGSQARRRALKNLGLEEGTEVTYRVKHEKGDAFVPKIREVRFGSDRHYLRYDQTSRRYVFTGFSQVEALVDQLRAHERVHQRQLREQQRAAKQLSSAPQQDTGLDTGLFTYARSLYSSAKHNLTHIVSSTYRSLGGIVPSWRSAAKAAIVGALSFGLIAYFASPHKSFAEEKKEPQEKQAQQKPDETLEELAAQYTSAYRNVKNVNPSETQKFHDLLTNYKSVLHSYSKLLGSAHQAVQQKAASDSSLVKTEFGVSSRYYREVARILQEYEEVLTLWDKAAPQNGTTDYRGEGTSYHTLLQKKTQLENYLEETGTKNSWQIPEKIPNPEPASKTKATQGDIPNTFEGQLQSEQKTKTLPGTPKTSQEENTPLVPVDESVSNTIPETSSERSAHDDSGEPVTSDLNNHRQQSESPHDAPELNPETDIRTSLDKMVTLFNTHWNEILTLEGEIKFERAKTLYNTGLQYWQQKLKEVHDSTSPGGDTDIRQVEAMRSLRDALNTYSSLVHRTKAKLDQTPQKTVKYDFTTEDLIKLQENANSFIAQRPGRTERSAEIQFSGKRLSHKTVAEVYVGLYTGGTNVPDMSPRDIQYPLERYLDYVRRLAKADAVTVKDTSKLKDLSWFIEFIMTAKLYDLPIEEKDLCKIRDSFGESGTFSQYVVDRETEVRDALKAELTGAAEGVLQYLEARLDEIIPQGYYDPTAVGAQSQLLQLKELRFLALQYLGIARNEVDQSSTKQASPFTWYSKDAGFMKDDQLQNFLHQIDSLTSTTEQEEPEGNSTAVDFTTLLNPCGKTYYQSLRDAITAQKMYNELKNTPQKPDGSIKDQISERGSKSMKGILDYLKELHCTGTENTIKRAYTIEELVLDLPRDTPPYDDLNEHLGQITNLYGLSILKLNIFGKVRAKVIDTCATDAKWYEEHGQFDKAGTLYRTLEQHIVSYNELVTFLGKNADDLSLKADQLNDTRTRIPKMDECFSFFFGERGLRLGRSLGYWGYLSQNTDSILLLAKNEGMDNLFNSGQTEMLSNYAEIAKNVALTWSNEPIRQNSEAVGPWMEYWKVLHLLANPNSGSVGKDYVALINRINENVSVIDSYLDNIYIESIDKDGRIIENGGSRSYRAPVKNIVRVVNGAVESYKNVGTRFENLAEERGWGALPVVSQGEGLRDLGKGIYDLDGVAILGAFGKILMVSQLGAVGGSAKDIVSGTAQVGIGVPTEVVKTTAELLPDEFGKYIAAPLESLTAGPKIFEENFARYAAVYPQKLMNKISPSSAQLMEEITPVKGVFGYESPDWVTKYHRDTYDSTVMDYVVELPGGSIIRPVGKSDASGVLPFMMGNSTDTGIRLLRDYLALVAIVSGAVSDSASSSKQPGIGYNNKTGGVPGTGIGLKTGGAAYVPVK